MILAGDVGGTKTLLGLFDPTPFRPRPIAIRSFPTLEFDGLATMIATFVKQEGIARSTIESGCFGAAGPVVGDTVKLTNVPWQVDARRSRAPSTCGG